ncbi:bifunctional PIG-L family deacetylase/class I SAM-dependent methyltransferase [Paenarthrobacter sp. AR 02]|uniref:bifunctional PIG-L family deacetylase/class I SAM-dependent methyltransferase n=1 Tax=Paenarthrobacter sp. AR 02 TaxID=2899821 RepID=UPI001F24CAB2|nr:bifunctional PIG-L family deacetylase/class I SAM-dependent methyltransferase [Paenarthrobacter sp. AR 02]MCF3138189.1 bifunctional PIG-L family deacetylase/class I SAM-dependent methyltransferase [Paenarthrobacter sp. AR 02]
MVAFSHTDTGTTEAEWLSSGVAALPELPLGQDELADMAFVVLAAHPDDETLGAGGLVAKLHSSGAAVELLLCTAGEASHPESPTTTPEQLAAVRLAEFDAAVSGLAPSATWKFLGLPDGKLAANAGRIAEAIRDAISAHNRPTENIVIVAPYRQDGHTDHDAVGATAAKVAEEDGHGLLEYPIWYWLWAGLDDPTWQSWVRVPLSGRELETKGKAMGAHTSQIEPLSEEPGDGTLLSGTFLEHFERPWETFAWQPSKAGNNTAADAERIFDEVHAKGDDPWAYTTSWYERRKRALTLAALPEESYESGLELGCSIGTLSEELAQRCQAFLGVEASGIAAKKAAERLSAYPSAEARHLTIPQEWPEGSFDLVVLSEMGYYLAPEELAEVFRHIKAAMKPGGTLLLCHWRHPISGWQLDAEAVHSMARQQLAWPTLGLYREKDFVLETLVAPAPAVSDGPT